MGNTRRIYSANTPLPLGYAVEWWESDEHYHWVRTSDPEDTYGDCHVNHWATWHYQANRDLGALMELGGWKSPDMVLRYAHTNSGQHAASVEAAWSPKSAHSGPDSNVKPFRRKV